MEKQLPRNGGFPTIKRIRQQSDFHCGPAVISMLASYIGVPVRQHAVVLSAHARETYRTRGMTVAELGKGITTLHPDCSFWYKDQATVADLDALINFVRLPVGVEWQGAFGEYADEDNGHYSMVTAIDIPGNTITLSDPFYYFAGTDRTFPIDEFVGRWWDINEVTDPATFKTTVQKDTRMLFLVTKTGATFPPELSLTLYRLS